MVRISCFNLINTILLSRFVNESFLFFKAKSPIHHQNRTRNVTWVIRPKDTIASGPHNMRKGGISYRFLCHICKTSRSFLIPLYLCSTSDRKDTSLCTVPDDTGKVSRRFLFRNNCWYFLLLLILSCSEVGVEILGVF